MTRCDQTCKYPCARDHRTRSEKIADMRRGATTPGERAAADAAAARVKPDAPPEPRQQPPLGWSFSTGTSTSNSGYQRYGPNNRTYRPPAGPEAQPAGSKRSGFYDNSEYAQFIRRQQREYEAALEQELLRRAQAAETLRAKGWKLPDDAEFFTPPDRGTNWQTQEVLREMLRRGKIDPDVARRAGFEEE
jgi:hypothetical protein